ncbi:L,D-transpeptidase [Paraburkholderia bryophila]|uniref:L,D-transpeptidase n=1 Tax=Paraburkholderia bryophila TaxID=420952 RepID=UPI000DD06A6A|nr:L,D-transpeptidase [Paraburkholderia bryophila]
MNYSNRPGQPVSDRSPCVSAKRRHDVKKVMGMPVFSSVSHAQCAGGHLRRLTRVCVAVLCSLSCSVASAVPVSAAASNPDGLSASAAAASSNGAPSRSASAPGAASTATNRPTAAAASTASPASTVAAPDAAGVVDPHRALLLRDMFAKDVTRRLKVPLTEQRAYAERLQTTLTDHALGNLSGQYVVMVDRNANVQALFIYFRAAPADTWQMIGAAPVSTGRPGEYDHFITPLGVFDHTPANMDFRSEGTPNENHIRGYGKRDMRIFDLGWAQGERGWGKGGISQMRFQMHATDPDRLEQVLGIRHSKGCVRIPASLNVFLDHYGILDAGYVALVESGKSLWVLKSDRQVTPWAGRYIVVVDSGRKSRPAWSPLPGGKARAKVPAAADTAD